MMFKMKRIGGTIMFKNIKLVRGQSFFKSRSGSGSESQRTHLSPCVSFSYHTMLNIVVRQESEPIPKLCKIEMFKVMSFMTILNNLINNKKSVSTQGGPVSTSSCSSYLEV